MEDNKYFEIFSETGALIQKGDLKDQDKDHFTFYVSSTIQNLPIVSNIIFPGEGVF